MSGIFLGTEELMELACTIVSKIKDDKQLM
jgi:hypothetical protein